MLCITHLNNAPRNVYDFFFPPGREPTLSDTVGKGSFERLDGPLSFARLDEHLGP